MIAFGCNPKTKMKLKFESMKDYFSLFLVRTQVIALIISLTLGLFARAFAKPGGGIDSTR